MRPDPGHELLFKEWMAEHRSILRKIARSFARSEADLADMEQEMMLQLWSSASSFSGRAKASTWIYKVSLNTALMWRRSSGRREERIEPGASVSRVAEGGPTPADKAAHEELLERLYGAIRSMPESDRALVLLMLDGLSYREIGEITGLTESHVGVALNRARAKLAERLKGVTDELK
jgi:RNA polymerase sigma-70 factor (ECF subfamily)